MSATSVQAPVAQPGPAGSHWEGPWRRYDIVKEFVIALLVIALLTVLLAALFSSPDDKPITLQRWSKADPPDFVATAVTELAGTSISASYGAPYNHVAGAGQKLGPVSLERLAGVRIPVDPAQDFVLKPLRSVPSDPTLTAALASYSSASPNQQGSWANNYGAALAKAPNGDPAQVPAGDYGPVPEIATSLLRLAQSGGLDGALTSEGGQFYASDYTKPLLFIADGSYMAGLASKQHLAGTQWGMMNETGQFPGQAWLWLYTFWYQVKPFSNSGNADVEVWSVMMVLTLGLALLPFIPGLRSLPEKLGVHRLIWRDWYRAQARAGAPGTPRS
ncbi:MAG TPA: hypothetical protein VHA57_01750 [Actinomycetota bacterium]|nr:hypothetical protein [Actinomycetota bacterium]